MLEHFRISCLCTTTCYNGDTTSSSIDVIVGYVQNFRINRPDQKLVTRDQLVHHGPFYIFLALALTLTRDVREIS